MKQGENMKRTVVLVLLTILAGSIFALPIPGNGSGPSKDKISQAWTPEQTEPPTQAPTGYVTVRKESKDPSLLFPLDETYTLAMQPNDDDYTEAIAIPFNFLLYGVEYDYFYINNNGNITFDRGYNAYTPWGFPIAETPMLAPFFADVDTRGTGSVWYKIESNRIIVTWDHVGYFSAATDRLNTFQVIFTDGTDPSIGLDNNVAFGYGDLAWTTGSASGGVGGLGGEPATVGINGGGSDLFYSQIGRFDHEGTDYDGAYDNHDGIDWLDWVIFQYDVEEAPATLTVFPTTIDNPIIPFELPVGIVSDDPGLEVYYASYPLEGNQNVFIPVGPGVWRAWAYYSLAWHQADVFPLTGPGTIAFTGVPFGAKDIVPIILDGEGQTLPVVLSSFNAVLTAQNYIKLQWVTQSETGVSGYNIYRSMEQDVNNSLLVSPLITATNLSYEQSYQFIDTEVYDSGIYYYWLQSRDFDGTSNFFGPVQVRFQPQDPGGEIPSLPLVTDLLNAYPNPFNPSTSLRYSVSEAAPVKLDIYNTRGQLIRSFTANPTEPGYYSQYWDGLDQAGRTLGSGIYLVRMTSSGSSFMKRVILSK